MFTPSQLEQLPIEVEKHFRELEIRVMSDIIRRIKMNSEITRTADYQLHRMSQLGAGSEEIKKSLEKALKSSGLHVDTIYDEVIAAGYAYDEKLYNAVGVKQTPFTENAELQQLISAVKTQTNDELKNITASLGFAKLVDGKRVFEPIADYYQKTLDTAFYDISTGLFDYNSVIKRVVQEMTNSGLRSVTYETGWSNRVDVAARRAIMTGVNQVTAHISDKNAEELGTEYFEVSWHGTARPSHQEWQGKVYTKQELIDICGLGSVEGLCGANCRHNYWAFIPGVSERVYTDEELELLNAKENLPREYNGKQYTAYEATQHQRKLETLMRKQRQDIKLYKEAGVSEEIVIAAQSRYRATMHEYVKFSKEMDLPQQMQRVYVDGLKDIGGHGRLKTIKKPIVSPQKPAVEETLKTYTGSQLDKMSLEQLRKLAEDTAVKYYDSGISGISFGGTSHKEAAALLATQGSKTSLKKDILSMQKKMQKENNILENSAKSGTMKPRDSQLKPFTKVKLEDIPPMQEAKYSTIKSNLAKKGVAVIQDTDGDAFLKAMGAEAMTLSDGSAVIFQSTRVPSASAVFEELIHVTQIREKGVIESTGNTQAAIEYLNREIEANEKLLRNKKAYDLTDKDIESIHENLEMYYEKMKEVKKDV